MKSSWRLAIQQRWQACSAREQHMLRGLGIVLLGLLIWLVLFAPAQHILDKVQAQRAVITQQWTQMTALQAEAKGLQQRTPLSRDNALSALQSITPTGSMQLTPQGDRVLVNVKAVPADVLAQWLTQSRAQAQVLPTEAHLTRVNPSSSNNAASALPAWEGTMVLQLPVGQAKAMP